MNIAPYVARHSQSVTDAEGRNRIIHVRGWSKLSVDEATTMAKERAKRVIEKLKGGLSPERYPYADSPICEEQVRELPGAIITRNSYGSLVLNCENAMFIDVDIAQTASSFLTKLWGREDPRRTAIKGVRLWAEQQGASVAIYETAGGLRLLLLHTTLEAGSKQSESIMQTLNADPLYIRLCATQKCFRARLTPKYWRCGLPRPPRGYPWSNSQETEKFRDWEKQYETTIRKFKTCSLHGTVGTGRPLPQLLELKKIHDEYCLALGSTLA